MEKEPSGAYAEGSVYCMSDCLSVFLCDTIPCHFILSHIPSIAQSEARKERMSLKAAHLAILVTFMENKAHCAILRINSFQQHDEPVWTTVL